MDKCSGNPIFTKEFRAQFASFVGVDLHKSSITLASADRDGQFLQRATFNTKCIEKIAAWIEAQPKPCWLAVEAVGFVEWFIDRFRDSVARLDIADATELARRRGKRRKTDPNDARDMAIRLSAGDCPLGWIADPDLMRLRKLGRHWRRLSRTLSRAKHGMKSILNATNLIGPKCDGASAHKWLLAQGHLLKPADQLSFRDLLGIVQLIEVQRERLRLEIIFANREPRFLDDVRILKSTPGIDEIWGCIIAAEVGPFNRFPNADALEYWSGLTPDNETTAGRTKPGHITKCGSATLRWALCKAGVTLCKSDARREKVRRRLMQRIGKARANVAVGRHLLRILYAMMRDRVIYQRGPATNHLARANKIRLMKHAPQEDSSSQEGAVTVSA